MITLLPLQRLLITLATKSTGFIEKIEGDLVPGAIFDLSLGFLPLLYSVSTQ